MEDASRQGEEHNQQEREIKRLNRLYAALSQVNHAIVRIRTREELFREVTRVLVEAGKFSMVWIGQHNPATHEIKVAAQEGDETGYLNGIRIYADDRPEGRGPCGTAIREGHTYVCNDFLNDPRTLPWRESAARAGWHSVAGFPIRLGEDVCCALMVYDHEVNFFGEHEVALLEEVAQTISFGLLSLERETLRNQSEAALRRSEEKFRNIFESAPVGIFQSTIGGRFLGVNATLAGMFCYDTPEEIVGAVTDITSQLFVDPMQRTELIRSVLESATFARSEVLYRRKDGTVFIATLSMRAVRNDNGDVAFLEGFVEDITERKHAEEEILKLNTDLEQRVRNRTAELEAANSALKKEIEHRKKAQGEITRLNLDLLRQKVALETVNRELESFSYSVSHDLRAPLRHLDGFSRILEEECASKLDESGMDCLQRIRAAAMKMDTLVNALLQLSRMTRTEIDLHPVDVSAMAREIVGELAKSGPDRNVTVDIEDGVVVMADPRLLRIVMDNLLGNAWKYTSKNNDACIELGTMEVTGKRACFVRDNGAGFDMAYAGKLFGAFQRLHSEAEFEGIGIGLATVQRIIHRHGGKVWAEGQVGKGATFYFMLE
ncbi:multi-sensor signal transduction histidine kinase [Geobacter metallireducens RCH3]|uniref:histidine kinase n=1 Tax=Geobacter metallireducens (strain ATCC 53774 / DSM 7210 / GS-15) TaxID=269799 RepID=Q39WX7_GEOMG|nr:MULTISPECIES: GAF domain-containing protein [Geobacter]ABB31247.1 sensor histidine kinase, GAF and PAS domain-containing [Geobacter metallireducens GS-15]EHP86489.1 multi-sensor signal transduction histidine kinase [Geobacter metallireducens RCH3]MBT1076563.1 GAF domain-containing protein [Geobacter grbiciae]